jgi:hypothetical protein
MPLLHTLRSLLCGLVKQAKRGLSGTMRPDSKPKKTRQGDGQRSRPSHGRKKSRGQGR